MSGIVSRQSDASNVPRLCSERVLSSSGSREKLRELRSQILNLRYHHTLSRTNRSLARNCESLRTQQAHPCQHPSPNRPASQSSAKRPRQRGNKANPATQELQPHNNHITTNRSNARPVKYSPLPRRIRLDRRLTIHSKHSQRKLGEGSTLRFQRVRR